ncbi:hypothetical protein HPB50_026104 [Hyalomma asiaticum]|uniref:Uncharacterized protein n=1 Tax=Hyalomma asiaticum TaxID=266040 RepID=A0ACB7TR62_HYAAI|nr:hypothetical protein HPB50_026104 [Hyalomma asiaticum]
MLHDARRQRPWSGGPEEQRARQRPGCSRHAGGQLLVVVSRLLRSLACIVARAHTLVDCGCVSPTKFPVAHVDPRLANAASSHTLSPLRVLAFSDDTAFN